MTETSLWERSAAHQLTAHRHCDVAVLPEHVGLSAQAAALRVVGVVRGDCAPADDRAVLRSLLAELLRCLMAAEHNTVCNTIRFVG